MTKFVISIERGNGLYAVYVVTDIRTNQVRYRGSLDGARMAQAQLSR
jgi:hypothetical protein